MCNRSHPNIDQSLLTITYILYSEGLRVFFCTYVSLYDMQSVDQWSEIVIHSAAEILPPNLIMFDLKVISGSLSSCPGLPLEGSPIQSLNNSQDHNTPSLSWYQRYYLKCFVPSFRLVMRTLRLQVAPDNLCSKAFELCLNFEESVKHFQHNKKQTYQYKNITSRKFMGYQE